MGHEPFLGREAWPTALPESPFRAIRRSRSIARLVGASPSALRQAREQRHRPASLKVHQEGTVGDALAQRLRLVYSRRRMSRRPFGAAAGMWRLYPSRRSNSSMDRSASDTVSTASNGSSAPHSLSSSRPPLRDSRDWIDACRHDVCTSAPRFSRCRPMYARRPHSAELPEQILTSWRQIGRRPGSALRVEAGDGKCSWGSAGDSALDRLRLSANNGPDVG